MKDIVAISGDFEGEKLDPLTSILVEKQMVPPQGLFFLVVGMHAGWQRLLVKKWEVDEPANGAGDCGCSNAQISF